MPYSGIQKYRSKAKVGVSCIFFFSFFKSACNGLFLLPEGKKMWTKIEIVSGGFWAVFPLKGKYLEELLWMTHCSRLSAPMSVHLSFGCMGVFTKRSLCLEEIQKGEWTNVNSGYQNNNDLHSSLQPTAFKKELGSATGVEIYFLRA